jgi:hypothetical protein
MQRRYKNACMLDVLSASVNRDFCVVLPTLNHAVYWWYHIDKMFNDYQPGLVVTTKTARFLRGSNIAVRLWVPYQPEPTQPMDFMHGFKTRCDYLNLYGLYQGGIEL